MNVSRFPTRATPANSIVYYRGNQIRYRIEVSEPRVAYEAPTGKRAWFSELCNFPATGEVCLRFSAEPDDETVSTGGLLVSPDGGKTWDLSTYQEVSGSGDPLALMPDGTWKGGTFAAIFYTRIGGNKKTLQMPGRVLSNGGRTMTITQNAITITGFPFDIEDGLPGFPKCNWYGEILRLSSTHWVSTILPTYSSQSTQVWCGWIESLDAGASWTWKSHVAQNAGNEGFSEASPIQLPNGDFFVVARVGLGDLAYARSSDGGMTWTPFGRLSPWCKSPRISMLSNNQDFVITTGGAPWVDVPPPGMISPIDGSGGGNQFAPAGIGFYISADPEARFWPVVDLAAHHNTMLPASMAFSAANIPTGYTGKVELDSGHCLVSYDQAGLAYFGVGHPNRIFVVDVYVTRV